MALTCRFIFKFTQHRARYDGSSARKDASISKGSRSIDGSNHWFHDELGDDASSWLRCSGAMECCSAKLDCACAFGGGQEWGRTWKCKKAWFHCYG
jgi:hypothetical protein